jgi:Rod binding domain-containing protein
MNPLSLSLSLSSLSPSLLSSPAAPTAALATAEAPLGRGPQAAREFEAHLLASLFDSLEKTFSTVPGQNAMPGADDYNYLGTQALASAVASSGGFGIAAMIAPHLGEHEGTR